MFSCTLENLVFANEVQEGLLSKFLLKCNMCNYSAEILSADPKDHKMNLNKCLVNVVTSIGCEFAHVQDILNNLQLPVLSQRKYADIQSKLFDEIEESAIQEIHKAADEEKAIALSGKNVEKDHKKATDTDKNYGQNCEKPDMTPEEYQERKEEYLKNIKKTKTEIKNIEERTREQANSTEWDNEGKAFEELMNKQKLIIKKCGLFISEKHSFLGASPDGLIGDNGLVAIKCPWSVQGQLAVTDRAYCVLCVWTPLGMKCETILKDDDLKENMFPFLEKI
ncbi:unnamed protein product [Ceutorhynchus assimilis]|uniref:Mutator-like transposase domain-containing protein n=1 Tax=Ceutorhynchus assimilis TaxID=467358 RepID=A0A9N9MJN4_9CUCU|nr:unnamed protein product [Ceutorhynchus assimilis]